MCVCSPKTLIKYEELPKFNGKRIKSIYAVYENSRYGTKKEGGGYIADILYYNCYVHDYDCGIKWGKDYGKSILKVKELPEAYKGMFGMVENKGARVFVTNHWFRMSDSANGSFTDQTLDMGGWAGNATTNSFSLYRGIDYMNNDEKTYAISEDSELAKKWDKILGKSFKVKEVEFADCGSKMEEGSLDFATKYPYEHTPIRIIDGLVYPDEKLPSWRWLHGMPYRVPHNATDKKYLRVWDEDLNRHLYLEKTETVEEGEEGLIIVDFPYKGHDIYGSEGNAYVNITRYNESCNFVFKTFTITQVNKKTGNIVCDSYRNMTKMERNIKGHQTHFYRITKISNSDYKEKED